MLKQIIKSMMGGVTAAVKRRHPQGSHRFALGPGAMASRAIGRKNLLAELDVFS
jgi:hypothetical protein